MARLLGVTVGQGFEPSREPDQPSRQCRNPIVVAQEWQHILDNGECASRADLARKLGVSRACVTQIVGLLDLAPDIVKALAMLGDPLPRSIVTERGLRPILKRPAYEQRRVLEALAGRNITDPTPGRARSGLWSS
jgi:hypothetical protein